MLKNRLEKEKKVDRVVRNLKSLKQLKFGGNYSKSRGKGAFRVPQIRNLDGIAMNIYEENYKVSANGL